METDKTIKHEAAKNSGKLPISLKLSYSIGEIADTVPYNLFYIYFLYFFTDVVGLPAAVGGTISLIVILWDAFTDPIVGYMSDNSKSKYGRRRPFMLAGVFPLFVSTVLLFMVVDFGPVLSFIYYLLAGILVWTSYKVYYIPFWALGAELTQDFNERNTLRTIAGFVIYFGVWMVSAGPMVVMDRVFEAGGTEATSWVLSALIFGGIGLICGLISWRFTRGKEIIDKENLPAEEALEDQDQEKEEEDGNKFFRQFKELIRLKPMRNILFMIFFMNISFAIASAAFVYLMSNNLGLSEGRQAFFWTCYTIMTFVILPIGNVLANKFGKKNTTISLNIVTIVSMMAFFFHGIRNFTQLLINTFLYTLSEVVYWTIGYSLIYDCCEVDEFVSGKRREGSIVGFSSFAQKFGAAFGMWISGLFLTLVGYDGMAEVQTASALKGILALNTIIPSVLVIIAVIFLFRYPITGERFEALKAALALRKEGKEYSTEGFEKLL